MRWSQVCGPLLIAAPLLVSASSPGSASINLAGALMVPTASTPKYCSGAFRYAARTGNSDISPSSAAQDFANDRYRSRTRYSAFAMSGLASERSPLLATTAMCGAAL
jgi:hypothetical protein